MRRNVRRIDSLRGANTKGRRETTRGSLACPRRRVGPFVFDPHVVRRLFGALLANNADSTPCVRGILYHLRFSFTVKRLGPRLFLTVWSLAILIGVKALAFRRPCAPKALQLLPGAPLSGHFLLVGPFQLGRKNASEAFFLPGNAKSHCER
jgi:hypothetical protein